MNKKLQLLGIVFNQYPIDTDEKYLNDTHLRNSLLKEFGVFNAIDQIVISQDHDNLSQFRSYKGGTYLSGDTVSNIATMDPLTLKTTPFIFPSLVWSDFVSKNLMKNCKIDTIASS
jgi:hypothetical protein